MSTIDVGAPANVVALRGAVQTLRSNGVNLPDPAPADEVFLAVGCRGYSLPTTFDGATAHAVDTRTKKPCQPDDSLSVIHLSGPTLRKAAGIVSGRSEELTPREKEGLTAMQGLIRKGGTFHLSRHNYHAGRLFGQRSAQETLTIPSTKTGQALLLSYLDTVKPPQGKDWIMAPQEFRDGRWPSVVVNGQRYGFETVDSLIDVAKKLNAVPTTIQE